MTRWSHRSIGATVIGTVALAASIVWALQRAGDRTLLPPFRYVVPHTDGYIVTGALQPVWDKAPLHLDRLFSPAASEAGERFAKDVDERLAESCMSRSDVSDPGLLGIDGTRGGAATIIGGDVVVAVPVSDSARFVTFIERLAATENLTLRADVPPGSSLSSIRIAAIQSHGLRWCSQGKPFDPGVGMKMGDGSPEVVLSVSRLGDVPAGLRLTCTAVLADGAERPCSCRVGPAGSDCAAGLVAVDPVTTRTRPFQEVVASRLSAFEAYFLEDHMAVVVLDDEWRPLSGRGRSAEAVANAADNWRVHRSDDTLLSTLRHLRDITGQASGFVVGSATVPLLPLAGRMHFALDIGSREVAARVLVPWQSLQANLLEQVTAPPRSGSSGAALSSRAEVQINDGALGDYLAFLERSDPEGFQRVFFVGFLREIIQMRDVGATRLGLLGVRDGVPDLALSVEMDAADAETLLLRQRVQMRHARDLEILDGAMTKLKEASPNAIVDSAARLSELGFLDPEARALWPRYRPATGGPPWFTPPANLGAGDFAAVDYDLIDQASGRRFRFVPPPVSDNDVRYRLGNGEDAREIDEAALREGRFRIVAFVDADRRRLVVATDTDTLRRALETPAGAEPAVSPTPKLSIVGDPHFLIGQGLLYPADELNSAIKESFLDFDQYHRLRARVDPLPSRLGISATIVLSHE